VKQENLYWSFSNHLNDGRKKIFVFNLLEFLFYVLTSYAYFFQTKDVLLPFGLIWWIPTYAERDNQLFVRKFETFNI